MNESIRVMSAEEWSEWAEKRIDTLEAVAEVAQYVLDFQTMAPLDFVQRYGQGTTMQHVIAQLRDALAAAGYGEEMALTLWQPWASLVALGVKRYETRSWRTSYRGRLAIHAAKRLVPVEGYAGALIAARLGEAGLRLDSLPLGAVVATCTLVDCYPVESLWGELVDMGDEWAFGDWRIGRYAWRLARCCAP